MRRLALAALVLLAGCSTGRDSAAGVYDGFESRSLGGAWETSRFAPGAVAMQSEIVHAGRGAARVTLHSGDIFETGINGSKDTERAELAEAERLYSKEGATYEYTFSEFFPADFPIVPVRLVIAQWKQYCHGQPGCADDGPVVALRYIGGRLLITQTVGRHATTLFESEKDLRNRWTDFRFQLRFTPGPNGLIRAWVDGRQVVDYAGVNAYPENAATGYRRPSLFYFKMGLYRDVMAQPMTVYLDEYRKRRMD